MKSYLVVTGVAFGLIVLAHVVRMFVEGFHVAREPMFLASTVIAVLLCAWAIRLLRKP